jgi:16S rRNA (cytosine967-C5)-methyltransferase
MAKQQWRGGRQDPGLPLSDEPPLAPNSTAGQSPGLAPRLAAAALLGAVVGARQSLDDAFAGEPGATLSPLSAHDRALTRSIATVALRRFGTLRKGLLGCLDRGWPKRSADLEWTLIVAAAQILYLHVPDHAAVDLAVQAVRANERTAGFAGLANAVLRNFARQAAAIEAAGDPLDDDTPAWLAQRWRRTYGEVQARALALAHRREPSIDLTVKSAPEDWARRLQGRVLPTQSVRLSTHQPIRELTGYGEGAWWVQDAAASLPARLLRVMPGERVLDLCAAPGGKTAQLCLAGGRVTALDRSRTRLQLLEANLKRLGLAAEIIAGDALSAGLPPADAVLLDAPCSATGTIRRHPDVAWTRKEADIARFADLQGRLLERAVGLLRPGGRLVYCTCSLEREEGEAQIEALLVRHPRLHRVPTSPAEIGGLGECVTSAGDLRTMPYHLADPEPRFAGLDGFYAARMQDRG